MSNQVNSVLGFGANQAAARAAVLAAKTSGEFHADRFAAWQAHEITDGTVSLPKGGAAQFFGRALGLSIPYSV